MRRLELGGGQVLGLPEDTSGWPSPPSPVRLQIPRITQGYTDAQLDDYGMPGIKRRSDYSWRPGVSLQITARFSHGEGELMGTAGFGFCNAPFGDPTVRGLARPQACWFFFGSPPNDLPLSPDGPGRGWFAATLDAARPSAFPLIPLAPFVLLANQVGKIRRRLWPWVQQQLGISFAPVAVDMTAWHDYSLDWQQEGCTFKVDGRTLLQTRHSPRGPLGFVCWIDNQYMVATAHGRFRWGTLSTSQPQWLEVQELQLLAASRIMD